MALHPSGYRFAGPCMVLLGLLALAAVPAQAEMPADALVMAKDISDIITLDPAEAFELTTGELLANVYDRIMTFEPEDPTVLTGGVAESHAVSDDGRTVTFRIRDGLTFHSGNPGAPGGRGVLAGARGAPRPVAVVHRHPVRLERGQRRRAHRGGRRPSRPHHHRGRLLARSGPQCAVRRRGLGGRPGARPGTRAGTETWAAAGCRPTAPAPVRSGSRVGGPGMPWSWKRTPATVAARPVCSAWSFAT